MSSAPSMPMFWDAYLADTTHLSTEEHGAYLLLLGAMWRRNGSVPDNDRDNARILGLTPAKWRQIKARLAPLLIFDNGQITQKNLQKIWKITQEKIAVNRMNGAKGGRPKTKENNEVEKPNGFVSVKPIETIPEPEPEPEVRETTANAVVAHKPPEQPKRAGSPKSGARGSRIPANWTPTPKDYAFASSEGLTREEINREADRFRDYWIAASGRTACKLDWEATWRNWIRSDLRKRPGSGAGNASRNGSRTGAFDRLAERLSDSAPRADAWQHDDSGAEGGDIVDIGPAQLTG
jgi:uncharacterized protein YdaU (DUF1376 family)